MMRFFITLLILFSFLAINAQQDALFSKYVFNSLTFNPAYAGSKDYLSISFLNRAQWLGWNNDASNNSGLSSQSLAAHLPLNQRVGLGVHFIGDAIGATRTNKLNLAYAYRIPFELGTIAVGLQGGISTWHADWRELSFQDKPSDPAFLEARPSGIMPNFGTGVYFQNQDFYLGVSMPSLLNLPLPSVASRNSNTSAMARTYSNLFIMAGGMINILPKQLSVKPSLLFRKTGIFSVSADDLSLPNPAATPSTLDLDCAILLQEILWLSAGIRTSLDSNTKLSIFNSSVAIYMQNGMRIGLGYDYDFGSIRSYASGSFELMLAYDFNYQISSVQSPRYF